MGEFNPQRTGAWDLLSQFVTPIIMAVVCGAVIGFPLAFWIGFLNDVAPPAELLMLAVYLSALYSAMSAAVLIGASTLQLVLGI